jgi:hypothetical protein
METTKNSPKSYILNSLEIRRAVNAFAQVEGNAKSLLREIIESMTIGKGGHMINQTINLSNAIFASRIGCSYSTVAKFKEYLHALGIIDIDGKDWEDYRVYYDGSWKRFKSAFTQEISLNQTFLDEFYRSAKQSDWSKRKITHQFKAPIGYQLKMQKRHQAMAESIKKYMVGKFAELVSIPVDNLLKSCEMDSVKYQPESCEKDSIFSQPCSTNNLNSNSFINSNPYHGDLPSDKNLGISKTNQLLSNALSLGKRELKKWNESVSKLCETLLMSDKTVHEVAQLMISQSYCNTIDEFFTKMNLKPKPS